MLRLLLDTNATRYSKVNLGIFVNYTGLRKCHTVCLSKDSAEGMAGTKKHWWLLQYFGRQNGALHHNLLIRSVPG